MIAELPTIVGVDGCKAGWVAAVCRPDQDPELGVYSTFRLLVQSLPHDAVIVVDMPIGLPERIIGSGRAAEIAARSVLKARRSSVFPIPARGVFDGHVGPFSDQAARSAAYREACLVARSLHDRKKAFAVQAFAIFPRIVEIDEILLEDIELSRRVIEGHPELAFCVLNGRQEMTMAKKARHIDGGSGEEERRAVLRDNGLSDAFLQSPLPGKVGRDDWLDACAMLLVAERYASGKAWPYPNPPDRDARGLPIAIWA